TIEQMLHRNIALFLVLLIVCQWADMLAATPGPRVSDNQSDAAAAWEVLAGRGVVITGTYEVVSFRVLRASKDEAPEGGRVEFEDLGNSIQTVVFQAEHRPRSSGAFAIRMGDSFYRADIQPERIHPSHRIYDFGEIAVYTAVAGGDAIRLSDRRKEVLF